MQIKKKDCTPKLHPMFVSVFMNALGSHGIYLIKKNLELEVLDEKTVHSAIEQAKIVKLNQEDYKKIRSENSAVAIYRAKFNAFGNKVCYAIIELHLTYGRIVLQIEDYVFFNASMDWNKKKLKEQG